MAPCRISVLTEQPETAAGTLIAAARLAGLVGPSEIDVLAFQRPLSVPIIAMTDGKFTSEQIAPFIAKERGRLSALGAIYNKWVSKAEDHNTSMHWNVIEGDATAAIRERGLGTDFIVLPRPTDRDNTYTQENFRAALFDTSRPILVTPTKPPADFGHRVGIAWRDDEHARQALVAAIPLLKNADQIHVFAGTREGQKPPVVPDVLEGRVSAATLHELPIGGRPFGEILLANSHTLGVDLLVMGAYFHSPLREWIFGGVTRFVLLHADIPLLMFHGRRSLAI